MLGIGKGAKAGILIKEAASLEAAKDLDTIVFDKTGTLTEGKPRVTHIISTAATKSDINSIIFAIESRSEHPLASAICAHFSNFDTSMQVDYFENIVGKGIRATVDTNEYLIGNQALMQTAFVSNIPATTSDETSVYVAENGKLILILEIADTIKPEAKAALTQLKAYELHLLTGDNQQAANKIAAEFGLTNVKAEVLPEDKINYIKALQAKGRKVAMIGDGINDSPALAQANVGIAIGTGTDVAIESAAITLLKGDLSRIASAIELSKATHKIIQQNLFWAFIYNIIGIPIAAGILYPLIGFTLNPMIAGAAMAFSSVSVVLNSLRLK
jgi:P-type Cu2+ transporter